MPDENLLPPGPAAIVVVAWTVAFAVVAVVRTDRSDL
jgi:hypothetical protein